GEDRRRGPAPHRPARRVRQGPRPGGGLRRGRLAHAGRPRRAGRRAPAAPRRMRVAVSIEVSAPRELVWEFVTDPTRYLHFMAGMTRFEVVGDQPTGVGARYRTLMRVGSAEIGGCVEVVEWDEPSDIAWNSVTGVDQRARWRLRDRP